MSPFERLSHDLLDQILAQLQLPKHDDKIPRIYNPHNILKHRKQRPLYATVSKTWQTYFEGRLFKSLNLTSKELEEATTILTGNRPQLVARINYRVILPSCDNDGHQRHETDEEQQKNNVVFSAAITNLFKFLKFLDVEPPSGSLGSHGSRPRNPITLSIDRIYSPSDLTNRYDCDTVERGPGYDLSRHRFRQSFLHLRDLEMPPNIERVNSFKFSAWSRIVSPSALVLIASCFSNLEILELELNDEYTIDPALGQHMRYEFSRAISHLHCKSLSEFELDYRYGTPSNHHLRPVSALDPGSPFTDHFSISLHTFIQGTNLTRITLSGPVVISPSLFWPVKVSASSATNYWPALKSFEVTFSPCTSDGDWYFIRHPHQTPVNDFVDQREQLWWHRSQQDEWNSDDEYDCIDLQEEASVLRALSNEQLESNDHGAGDFPLREFRTWPNNEMILPLLKAMGRAAAFMPVLEKFTLGLSKDCWNPTFNISFTTPRLDSRLFLGRQLDLAYRLSIMTGESEPQWKVDEQCLDLWRLAVPSGGGELQINYGLPY